MPKPIASFNTPQPSKSLTRAVKPPTRYDDELAEGHFTAPTKSKMGKQQASKRGSRPTTELPRKRKRTDSIGLADEAKINGADEAGRNRKAPARRGGRGSRGSRRGSRGASRHSSRQSSSVLSVDQAVTDAVTGLDENETIQEVPRQQSPKQPAERAYTAPLGPVLIPSVQTLNTYLVYVQKQLAEQPRIPFDNDLNDYGYGHDGSFRPKHQLYEPLRKFLDRDCLDNHIDHWKDTRDKRIITLRYKKHKTPEFQHPKEDLDMSDSDAGDNAMEQELSLSSLHPTLAVAIMDEIAYACENHQYNVFWPPRDTQSDDSAFPYLPKMANNDVLAVLLDCRLVTVEAIRERQRGEYHDVPDMAVKSCDIERVKKFLGERDLPESLLCDYLDGEWSSVGMVIAMVRPDRMIG